MLPTQFHSLSHVNKYPASLVPIPQPQHSSSNYSSINNADKPSLTAAPRLTATRFVSYLGKY